VSGWKVPDWRDPAQYPRDCSLRQWAWEFLRRNPEYRKRWREHIEPFYDPTFRYQDQDVGLVGPAYGVPADKQAELVHRFGLESFPPSPNGDYPPLFSGTGLRWTEGDRVSTPRVPNPVADEDLLPTPLLSVEAVPDLLFCPVFDEVKTLAGPPKTRQARLLLYPGQIAVVFDLTRPVRRQMAASNKLFAEEKKRAGHRKHQNRIRLFASYLRVLDGIDDGATPTKIGAMLFPRQSKKQRLFYVRDYRDAAIKKSLSAANFIKRRLAKSTGFSMITRQFRSRKCLRVGAATRWRTR
jgi:Family of unknown function (DUF6499)